MTAFISGLAPATTYHFRVVATNATGTTLGADRTFTTSTAPPAATTGTASSVGETIATLNAVVNPNGTTTTYHFDIGVTAGYGDRLPVTDVVAGADNLSVAVQLMASPLLPATTYHFRVVATNLLGTTYGDDQSFTTAAPAPFSLPTALPPPTALPSLPPATRPVLGKSATIAATSGEILVQLPESGDLPPALGRLDGARRDDDRRHARHPQADERQELERQAANRAASGAGPSPSARPAGSRRTTVLTLTAPMSCAKSRLHTASTTANKRMRQLWGKDNNGRFVTRGRSAVATVRGTAWFTRDTCEGTLVSVTRGSVAVRDLVRKVTVIVRAGHKYLARLR